MWSPVRTSSPETPRSTVVDMCRLPSQELNQNPTPESRVIAPRGRKQRQGSSHQDDAARIANAEALGPDPGRGPELRTASSQRGGNRAVTERPLLWTEQSNCVPAGENAGEGKETR